MERYNYKIRRLEDKEYKRRRRIIESSDSLEENSGSVPTTPDRQICRKPDTGQSVHITSDPGRNSDSQVLTSVEFGPARTMDDEIVVLWWYLNRRQNKRKHWVHPILRERFSLGTFETLMGELRRDESKFFNYFRMTATTFDDLLGRLDIRVRDTSFRECICPEQTDTGTNSFTLLRARSFYRQFVVTKRSVKMPGSAKMPDPG
ncbi:Uncharacterized protein OBRU01_07002 [Operophtera brumata]|uniref:Uncharacterized protein n=1 Tax=Operophtera brumata TaxID=104452 RepID=A0A0L7LIA6_OPEBR|nr:Uncharacterized protein OBRU01_07002 [Operophtera brumata]